MEVGKDTGLGILAAVKGGLLLGRGAYLGAPPMLSESRGSACTPSLLEPCKHASKTALR